MRKDPYKRELKRFGENLRDLRKKESGLSLEKFAAKTGFDRGYYWGLENGRRNPTLITILRLARALGVSPSNLFKG
jgi:transcriptional regulator with XRE-family HTH domain